MTRRLTQLLLALAIGVLAASYCYDVYSTFERRWNYLTWDPAAHGWDGMRLALDIRELDVLQLVSDTNQLVLWPPLHSYLQIPYFLMFGFEFRSTVLCSLTFLALFAVAITWLHQQITESWEGWVVLMALVVSSPFFLGYATMPMLEIFGATLTVWAASLFLRRSYWFPLSLMLLFFLKYNYFLYVFVAMIAATISLSHIRRLIEILRPIKLLVVIAGLFLALALIIVATGGFQIGPFSIRGIGNPAYIFFLLSLFAVFWKRQHRILWNLIRASGWKWFVIPVFAWLIIPVPNRVKTILSFAISRPFGGPPASSPDYYLFYLEKLPLYFSDHWIAWLGLAVALSVAIRYRKKMDIRFISSLFLLPLLLMTLNQNKQERYLFTFIPPLWILMAYGASLIPWRSVRWLVALGFVAIVTVTTNLEMTDGIVRGQFIALRNRTPLHFIAERIANAKEVRVLGTTNELNPAMIQYHTGRKSGFKIRGNFDWEIEPQPSKDLDIICIDCEAHGTPLRTRTFADGLVVRHSFLDTPEGPPYNPH